MLKSIKCFEASFGLLVRGRQRDVDSAKKSSQKTKVFFVKKYKNVFEASFGLLVRGRQRGVDGAKETSQTKEGFFDKIV